MTVVSGSSPRPQPLLRSMRSAIVGTVRTPRAHRAGGWGTGQVILVVVVVALNLLGLAMVLSASSVSSLYDGTDTWYHFRRQGTWIGLGTVAIAHVLQRE